MNTIFSAAASHVAQQDSHRVRRCPDVMARLALTLCLLGGLAGIAGMRHMRCAYSEGMCGIAGRIMPSVRIVPAPPLFWEASNRLSGPALFGGAGRGRSGSARSPHSAAAAARGPHSISLSATKAVSRPIPDTSKPDSVVDGCVRGAAAVRRGKLPKHAACRRIRKGRGERLSGPGARFAPPAFAIRWPGEERLPKNDL